MTSGDVFVQYSRKIMIYCSSFESLLLKWHSLGTSSEAGMEEFLQWFMSNKVDVISNTMLQCVRKECSFINLPDIITTNPNESINAMLIKHKQLE